MKSINRQSGISFVFMLVLIGLFGYAIFIGIKLAPVYMEFYSIRSSIDGLAAEMKTRNMNRKQAIDLLDRRLTTNYVSVGELKPPCIGCEQGKKDVFHFKRTKKETEIGIHYEKRVPMVANVTAALEFDYVTKVPLSQ